MVLLTLLAAVSGRVAELGMTVNVVVTDMDGTFLTMPSSTIARFMAYANPEKKRIVNLGTPAVISTTRSFFPELKDAFCRRRQALRYAKWQQRFTGANPALNRAAARANC